MEKIKILFGLEAAGGGALKHLVYLVTRLDNNIFDLTVILSNVRNKNIKEEIAQIKSANAKVFIVPMCREVNPVKDIRSFLYISSLIRRKKFDIVHAHSSKAGALFRLAASLRRIPLIYYTPHCFYFQGKKGLKKTFFVLLEKLLARITTKIIVSENEQQELIKNNISPASKVININNAIDFDEYQESKEVIKTKTKYGINENAFIVGAVGRLVPQKGWDTYIYAANEVLKSYPETVFLIVGDGELQEEIQDLIIKLNIEGNIILTGHVQEIYKIYGIIDVLVNTSLWEGLSYVFLEAMKYKKPIVATNTGCDSSIIHKETGFISPIKDFYSIAEKIIILLEDKSLVIKMGEKGMEQLTQKYSFELFINKHEELYKKHIRIKR